MKLVVLDGPMEGKQFPLAEGSYTVGRKPETDVCLLSDNEISRAHCRISREGGALFLEDLGSANGTWIDEQRISDRVELGLREIFRIGRTRLAVLEEGDDSASVLSAQQSAQKNELKTMVLEPGGVISEDRRGTSISVTGVANPREVWALGEGEDSQEALRKRLRVFQDVSEALAGKLEIQDLLYAVLQSISNAIPAERAYVFLAGPDAEKLIPAASWPPGAASQEPVAVSRTLLSRVFSEGVGLLVMDTLSEDTLRDRVSIRAGDIRSAMCVPLMNGDEVRAVLQMDASAASMFVQEDLELLTAIANQTALALVSSQLYEELRAAQQQLLQSEKLSTIGTLAASIAHDVRNVLTPISMVSSRVLSMESLDPRLKEVFERQIQRLRALTQQLLSFSRGDTPTLAEADVNQGVEESVALVQTEARHSDVHIETELSEGLPAVTADLNRLDQVFVNLMINAIQAMETQGGGNIRIRTYPEDGDIVIRLADTGPGIPPETLEKIFQPFFTTKGAKGNGLGLFSCKRIVEEEHRGRLDVESRPGEGTTFIVRLPAAGAGR